MTELHSYGYWSKDHLEDVSKFIAPLEGKRNHAYLCEAGRWTIGHGRTKNVCPGDVCTDEQAWEWLKEDVLETINGLARYVNVPVSLGEFIALTSLAFNVGVNRVARSKLLLKLNQGNREGASLEFLDFNLVNGKVSKGLTKRRKIEYEAFLS